MRTKSFLAVAASAALLATPGLALANGADDHPSASNHPSSTNNPGTKHKPATPGPGASSTSKGKAYGKYCQGQSKKHVKGEKGTAFSRCVTAMAKLASGTTSSPKTACKSLSKKHVKGEKGTPYSRCIVAAAKLLKDKHDEETTSPTTGSTTS